jgi:hypothetical protein
MQVTTTAGIQRCRRCGRCNVEVAEEARREARQLIDTDMSTGTELLQDSGFQQLDDGRWQPHGWDPDERLSAFDAIRVVLHNQLWATTRSRLPAQRQDIQSRGARRGLGSPLQIAPRFGSGWQQPPPADARLRAIRLVPARGQSFFGVVVRRPVRRLLLETTRSAPSVGEIMLHPPLSQRTW